MVIQIPTVRLLVYLIRVRFPMQIIWCIISTSDKTALGSAFTGRRCCRMYYTSYLFVNGVTPMANTRCLIPTRPLPRTTLVYSYEYSRCVKDAQL